MPASGQSARPYADRRVLARVLRAARARFPVDGSHTEISGLVLGSRWAGAAVAVNPKRGTVPTITGGLPQNKPTALWRHRSIAATLMECTALFREDAGSGWTDHLAEYIVLGTN